MAGREPARYTPFVKKNSVKKKLAIHGGAPVRGNPMPARFSFGPDEIAMVQEVFDHYKPQGVDPGYQGHFEERYCAAFCETMGGGYADAVATGTASLYVAIAALDLPKGSEVLVSPITDPGTINAIILRGLKPRLADSKPGSYNVGVEQFVARLSPETRAAIIVHSTGQPTEIDAIVAEAHARGVRVIEDCSQAHGARWRDQPVGTFGDIAAFSTMYRKAHMTGGSGGVVYTRDRELHRLALAHADRGKARWRSDFSDSDPTDYLFPALNFHTDELSCAIGIASLRRLPATIRARLAYVRGLDRLHNLSRVCRPIGWTEDDSPFIYPVVVDPERIQCSKIDFAKAVRAENIGLNPHYAFVVSDWHWVRPYLADDFDCPNAHAIRDSSFCLYLNEKYGPAEIEDTVQAIAKVESILGR